VEREVNQTREDKVAATKIRMAELAAKFIERSGREIETMREVFAKLSVGEAGALVELRHFAHRMCGTGATLGFEALADCAARIEELADSCAPGSLPDAATLAGLGAGIDALGAQLALLAAANKDPPAA
jgi:chemotaxis protein histidine kinase CheA